MLELEPRNVDALLRNRDGLWPARAAREAIVTYQKAINLDPEYYCSYQLLGEYYYHRGRYEQSAEQFSIVIKKAPGFFDGYSSLAAALVELGRYDEAEEALRKSLTIRETAQGLNNLGAIRSLQRRFAEAVELQKKALTYESNNYLWVFNVADNLRWAGQVAAAKPYYRKAQELAKSEMTINPQAARARAYFAYFSAHLGDKPRAEDEIAQAISLAPGDNELLRRAVLTYEALGERERAIDLLPRFTPAELNRLTQHQDLADFCQDPRFKQLRIDKGGQ